MINQSLPGAPDVRVAQAAHRSPAVSLVRSIADSITALVAQLERELETERACRAALEAEMRDWRARSAGRRAET